MDGTDFHLIKLNSRRVRGNLWDRSRLWLHCGLRWDSFVYSMWIEFANSWTLAYSASKMKNPSTIFHEMASKLQLKASPKAWKHWNKSRIFFCALYEWGCWTMRWLLFLAIQFHFMNSLTVPQLSFDLWITDNKWIVSSLSAMRISS